MHVAKEYMPAHIKMLGKACANRFTCIMARYKFVSLHIYVSDKDAPDLMYAMFPTRGLHVFIILYITFISAQEQL